MKKIKKFKIHFTPYYIKQFVKKNYHKESLHIALPENIEEIINNKIAELKKLLLPAVVYDTFPYEKIKELLPYEAHLVNNNKSKSSKLFPNKVSLFAINIDSESKLISEATTTTNAASLEAIVTKAIINDGINKSINFVRRLLEEEIGKEPFMLDTMHIILEKEKIGAISSLLDTAKINITEPLLAQQQECIVIGYTYWLSRKKYITLAHSAATASSDKK